jgi:hypothetical protein
MPLSPNVLLQSSTQGTGYYTAIYTHQRIEGPGFLCYNILTYKSTQYLRKMTLLRSYFIDYRRGWAQRSGLRDCPMWPRNDWGGPALTQFRGAQK